MIATVRAVYTSFWAWRESRRMFTYPYMAALERIAELLEEVRDRLHDKHCPCTTQPPGHLPE